MNKVPEFTNPVTINGKTFERECVQEAVDALLKQIFRYDRSKGSKKSAAKFIATAVDCGYATTTPRILGVVRNIIK